MSRIRLSPPVGSSAGVVASDPSEKGSAVVDKTGYVPSKDRIQKQAQMLMDRRQGQRLADQWEAAEEFIPFTMLTSTELYSQVDEEINYRIADLWPEDGSVLLVAPAKAGKTTIVLNLVKCLLTGEDFLGEFEVRQLDDNDAVLYLNMEVTDKQIRNYMVTHGVPGDSRLMIANLRGIESNMNLFNEQMMELMVQQFNLSGATILIVDPLGPIMSVMGVDENDNNGIRNMYRMFDSLRHSTKIKEIFFVHHTGHAGEHTEGRVSMARGASNFAATPDALWNYYNLDLKDPESERVIRAKGRDVELSPHKIVFDKETKTVTLGEAVKKVESKVDVSVIKDEDGKTRIQAKPSVTKQNVPRNKRLS